jgi:hypothetical protein
VIGVVVESGSRAFTDLDKSVYMPVTAAMDLYGQRFLTYAIVQPEWYLAKRNGRARYGPDA